MAKLAIKSDNRKQNLLLPPSLDELVPENHMVRVVDSVIDSLDISDILSTYRGGGNSAFNPRMMLKVLVFAYLSMSTHPGESRNFSDGMSISCGLPE